MIIEEPEELQMYIDFMMKSKIYDNIHDLIDDLKYEFDINLNEQQIENINESEEKTSNN